MQSFMRDVRYAVRVLGKRPAFTVLAVICLALGIGANAAIFSVVNGVLLKPLSFPHPDRLIAMATGQPSVHAEGSLSPPDFVDYRAGAKRVELAAWAGALFSFRASDAPKRLRGAVISSNLFHVLGVSPMLGRGPSAEEELPKRDREAVLSWDLWKSELGGDQQIVGKTIRLDATEYTVIGVMPKGFEFPIGTRQPTELWVPLTLAGDSTFEQQRGGHFLRAVGRLAPGVTAEQARAELRSISARLSQLHPATNSKFTANVEPLQENLVGDSRLALLVLAGAVGFLLLIACANVANLMLARATLRTKEVAVRTALGASRMSIVRQLLTESVLLALLGGAVGLLLASWGTDFLLGLATRAIPRVHDVTLDWSVVGFTAAVAIASGILFGLAPALQVTRTDINTTLKEGGRSVTGAGGTNRTRSVLVVAEVALSLMLLAGAGLLSATLLQLQRVDPGFDPRHVATTLLSLSSTTYDSSHKQIAFFDRLVDRVRAIPGVTDAAAVTILPESGSDMVISLSLPDEPHGPDDPPLHAEQLDVASPGYFRTVGIPVRQGRDFTSHDTDKAPWVMVVSESFAKKYWPGQDPIGQRAYVGYGGGFPMDSAARTVVGVVGDVRRYALDEDPRPMVYIPMGQAASGTMTLVARTRGTPENFDGAIRHEVIAMDPDQSMLPVRSFEWILSESLDKQRFSAFLLGLFAVVALALSAVGIFGVMTAMVTQRTREIAVRMALGAQPRDVLRMVVSHGAVLAGLGVVIGLIGAFALSRVIRGLLYGVGATDPVTLLGVSLLLGAVALIACWLPARRATRVDPIVVLREE